MIQTSPALPPCGFVDNAGRAWRVTFDAALIQRLRDRASIDLRRPTEAAPVMEDLANDPFLLAKTLYLVCEGEIESRGMEPEDFARVLGGGDTISRATTAFIRALSDFWSQQT